MNLEERISEILKDTTDEYCGHIGVCMDDLFCSLCAKRRIIQAFHDHVDEVVVENEVTTEIEDMNKNNTRYWLLHDHETPQVKAKYWDLGIKATKSAIKLSLTEPPNTERKVE